MEFENYQNERFNRFMAHQLRRLEDCRVGRKVTLLDGRNCTNDELIELAKTDPDLSSRTSVITTAPNSVLYFRICDSLIRYSSVFYTWQLNRTVPN